MTNESAVQFATASRIHMGLPVKNLEKSIAFYRTLFGHEPCKTRVRYAKFEVDEPPVNLALNEVQGNTAPVHPVSHFGIQVKSSQAIEQVAERLAAAGIQTRAENNVTCCYAVQNKVWATDPDGNKWEVYVVLDDMKLSKDARPGTCCTELPGIMEKARRGDAAAALAALQNATGLAGCSCTSSDQTASR
jgi:catechol 2,3-dioxygenase-like lactoylglutathione lyase family enzyme